MRDPRQTLRTIPFRGTADRQRVSSSDYQSSIEAYVIEVLLDRQARAVGLIETIDGPRLIVTSPPEGASKRDAFGNLIGPCWRAFALVLEGGTVDETWRFIGTIQGCNLGIQVSTLASLEHSVLLHVFEVVLRPLAPPTLPR